MPKIVSINISSKKGEKKLPVDSANIVENFGIENDAHAEAGSIRMLSLLANESVDKMRQLGLELSSGDFGENITTEGIDFASLPVGTRLKSGTVILEITQHGKKCHGEKCEIFRRAGDCIMPREGVFARIISGGALKPGDTLDILNTGGGINGN